MKIFSFNEKCFRPVFVVDKEKANQVADVVESPPHTNENGSSVNHQLKRNSDSHLYKENLKDIELKEKTNDRVHSAEDDRENHMHF
jgi:hypothetical protein